MGVATAIAASNPVHILHNVSSMLKVQIGLTEEDLSMAKRVIILGIDGAGRFVQEADAPHLHALLQAGAYSYDAQTVFPSISAECWGSLLYGVSPDQHGLDNDRAIHGQIPESFPYASLFKLARQQWPDAPLSAFSCWEPINTGIIENTINVHMESKPDPELTEAIVDYIHEQPDFKLMFIQLDHLTARATSTDSVPISSCYRLPLRIST